MPGGDIRAGRCNAPRARRIYLIYNMRIARFYRSSSRSAGELCCGAGNVMACISLRVEL